MNVNQQPTPMLGSPSSTALRRAAASLAVLALAGCSAVPLSALWSLRQLDFWTLDPTQVQASALLPSEVGAKPDALRVTLKAERGGGSGEVLEEHLALHPVAGAPPPPEAAPPGTHWLPLAFGDAEVARFHAYRNRLAAWKAADGKVADRRFTVSVEPALCSSAAASGTGAETAKVVVSAWLRWKPGQAPVQVLDRASLKDLDPMGKAAPPRLPACA